MRVAACVCLMLGTAASAQTLRLDFKLAPYPLHNETPNLVEAKVRKVAFIDHAGKTRWKVAPPRSLTSFLTMKPAATAYLADPVGRLETLGLFPGITLARSQDVVLYAKETVLVFAAANGELLFEHALGMSGFGALPFLHANVTWSCGSETTTRRVGMEPFLMACGDRVLVYFVQGFAVFATAPWQLMATHLYPDVPSQWRHTLAGTTLTITRID